MTLLADSAPWQPDALDRALASLEWTLLRSERIALDAGRVIREPRGAVGFVYVSRGSLTLTHDGDALALTAGDLVFFTREHDRMVRADRGTGFASGGEPAEVISVAVTPSSDRPTALDGVPSPIVVHGFDALEPNMPAIIEGMPCTGADDARRRGSLVLCSRIATMIISAGIRLWAEHGCAPARWLRDDQDPHIRRAVDALHAEIDRAWSVEELARVATMSRSAFAARFREVVGQSPAGYLASVRMDAGRELLLRPELSVGDVARALGYGSDDGFSRAFRRVAGVTPQVWRGRAVAGVARV
jgi:AraC-like DNA-binding protein